MKSFVAYFLFIIIGAGVLHAQSSAWKIDVKHDIYIAYTSPEGKYCVYLANYKSDPELFCIDLKDGHKVWAKKLKDIPELEQIKKYNLWGFVSDELFYLGENKNHEWINVAEGTIVSSVPIVGDSWHDLFIFDYPQYPSEKYYPLIQDKWALFYFDDGFQIIDMVKHALVQQGSFSRTSVQKEFVNDILMVPTKDSTYFFDTRTSKIVYIQATKHFNSTVNSPFYVYNNRMLLFNEDNIPSIDLGKGIIDVLIPVDPDDPDYYKPVIVNEELALLVGLDDVQKLYDVKTSKIIWEMKKGDIPGYIDQVINTQKNDAVCTYYDKEGIGGVALIDIGSGTIKWKKSLLKQEGSYEPGHRRKSGAFGAALLGAIASVAASSILNTGFNPYYNPVRYTVNVDLTSSLFRQKSTEAYIQFLDFQNEKMNFILSGKLELAFPEAKNNRNVKEAFLSVDIQNGNVVDYYPCNVISNDKMEKYNAYAALQDERIYWMKDAIAIIGQSMVYIFKAGKIESSFPTRGKPRLVDIKDSVLSIRVFVEGNKLPFSYWKIDVSKVPSTQTLLVRSDDRYIINTDFLSLKHCFFINEDEINGYNFTVGEPPLNYWSTPAWKYTFKDLDIGDINRKMNDESPAPYPIQGIYINGDKIILMGEDALAYISTADKCKWRKEWRVSAQWSRLGVMEIDSTIFYSVNDDTRIIKEDCSGAELYNKKISSDNALFVPSRQNHFALIIRSASFIECFRFKN